MAAMYPCLFKPRLRNKGQASERWEWSIGLDAEQGMAEAQQLAGELLGQFKALNTGLRPGKNGLPYYEIKDELQRSTGVWRFQFSRRQLAGNGSANLPPFVQDAQGHPWPADVLIGNGSLVRVAYTIWKWNPNGEAGPGIGLNLEGVRVIMLVPYEAPPPPDYSGAFGGPEAGAMYNAPQAQAPAIPAGQQAPALRSHGFTTAAPTLHATGTKVAHQQPVPMSRREVIGMPQGQGWDSNSFDGDPSYEERPF